MFHSGGFSREKTNSSTKQANTNSSSTPPAHQSLICCSNITPYKPPLAFHPRDCNFLIIWICVLCFSRHHSLRKRGWLRFWNFRRRLPGKFFHHFRNENEAQWWGLEGITGFCIILLISVNIFCVLFSGIGKSNTISPFFASIVPLMCCKAPDFICSPCWIKG